MDMKNSEGYLDPTATKAIKTAGREEDIGKLMRLIRMLADVAGFEVVSRITFRDKKTGAIYD